MELPMTPPPMTSTSTDSAGWDILSASAFMTHILAETVCTYNAEQLRECIACVSLSSKLQWEQSSHDRGLHRKVSRSRKEYTSWFLLNSSTSSSLAPAPEPLSSA